MPNRDVVFPAGRQALYERNRYSPAVRANGFLFVSGQVGNREDRSPEANFETIWSIVPEFWGEAPHPTLTGIGVTWLYGFQFEIKVIAKLPRS